MLVEKNSWKNLIKTLIKYLGICLLIFFIFLLNHEIDKRLNGEWKENSQRIEKTRPEVIYTDDISDFDVNVNKVD